MKLARWLYLNLWKKPKDIRGVAWTVCFYLALMLGFIFWTKVSQRGLLLDGLLWAGAWWLFQYLNSKPRRLGRPLPYRRRR